MKTIICLMTLLIAGCAQSAAQRRDSGLTRLKPETVKIDMAAADVVRLWGRPNSINRTQTKGGDASEQWVYETYLGRSTGSIYRFVYLVDNRVVAIQN